MPNGKAEQELIGMERDLSEALVHFDTAALDRIWSDDFIFTAPNGRITTKAQRIAGVKSSAKSPDSSANSSNNDEIKVHLFENTAVVTVHSTWNSKTNEQEYREQYQATHVWVKQQGRWQLVAAHVTPVARK
jgi:ketosteroid isomerase-like protein